MSQLKVFRLAALPQQLVASGMYIVKSADAGLVEVTFTGDSTDTVLRIINKADVQSMIQASSNAAVKKSGDTMQGPLEMDGANWIGVGRGTAQSLAIGGTGANYLARVFGANSGDLHLDALADKILYLNYEKGSSTTLIIGDGNEGVNTQITSEGLKTYRSMRLSGRDGEANPERNIFFPSGYHIHDKPGVFRMRNVDGSSYIGLASNGTVAWAGDAFGDGHLSLTGDAERQIRFDTGMYFFGRPRGTLGPSIGLYDPQTSMILELQRDHGIYWNAPVQGYGDVKLSGNILLQDSLPERSITTPGGMRMFGRIAGDGKPAGIGFYDPASNRDFELNSTGISWSGVAHGDGSGITNINWSNMGDRPTTFDAAGLVGGVLTGTVAFPNALLNRFGDDTLIGDCNLAGHLALASADSEDRVGIAFRIAKGEFGSIDQYDGPGSTAVGLLTAFTDGRLVYSPANGAPAMNLMSPSWTSLTGMPVGIMYSAGFVSSKTDDWNAITTPGVYKVGRDDGGAWMTGSDKPNTYPFGNLVVGASQGSLTQKYTPHRDDLGFFERIRYDGSPFTPWKYYSFIPGDTDTRYYHQVTMTKLFEVTASGTSTPATSPHGLVLNNIMVTSLTASAAVADSQTVTDPELDPVVVPANAPGANAFSVYLSANNVVVNSASGMVGKKVIVKMEYRLVAS